ncbi:DUF1552 domain-containing protein [Agaribacterium haliotis]|uniref:DUF1552 domain-containing protein n=1 Tax=Agaribacterium haliotis TaxID=2013869 RepID=UPI000BB577DD|nr:DUF1552 domain-containing protein [Agaribacterium haliotis]
MKFSMINHYLKPKLLARVQGVNTARRAFLKRSGLSSALAPFLPLLEIERAYANDEAPKRLVLCNYNHGMLYDHWRPSGSTRNFELNNHMHQAFVPFKDKMLIFDQLKHLRTDGNNHFGGMCSMWTGAKAKTFAGGDEHGLADGPSIDQFLVQRLKPQTLFSSLQFGVASRGGTGGNGVNIYGSALSPIVAERDPIKMFDRIFMGVSGDSPEVIALRERRKSVLDLVYQDLQTLNNKVGAADKTKIEAHLDAVRATEMRNEASFSGSCVLPEKPNNIDYDANDMMPFVAEQMIDLLAACLRCDLTRFCSLQFSVAINNVRFNWLNGADGKPITQGHHDLSHAHKGSDEFFAYEAGTRWYMQQFASLLAKLDESAEGGGSVLDNSLVVIGSEISLGNNHGREPMPYLSFGSLGGRVNSGQFLNAGGESHGRLLTGICHAFDQQDVQRFGSLDTGSGALPGFLL